MNRLDELVHIAIGRASMCWSEIPQGTYNDQLACKIAQELIDAINLHFSAQPSTATSSAERLKLLYD